MPRSGIRFGLPFWNCRKYRVRVPGLFETLIGALKISPSRSYDNGMRISPYGLWKICHLSFGGGKATSVRQYIIILIRWPEIQLNIEHPYGSTRVGCLDTSTYSQGVPPTGVSRLRVIYAYYQNWAPPSGAQVTAYNIAPAAAEGSVYRRGGH